MFPMSSTTRSLSWRRTARLRAGETPKPEPRDAAGFGDSCQGQDLISLIGFDPARTFVASNRTSRIDVLRTSQTPVLDVSIGRKAALGRMAANGRIPALQKVPWQVSP